MIEGDRESFEDMGARLCLCELVLRAPRDDRFLMADVVPEHLLQVHDDGLTIDEGEHDDAKAVL